MMAQRIDEIGHSIILLFLIGCMMIKWARRVKWHEMPLLEKKQLYASQSSVGHTVVSFRYR